MSDTMSEGTGAAEGGASEALTAAAAVPAPEANTAPVEAPAEIDLDTEPADDVYSDPAKAKALVASLRKEAAANRVKAKEAAESASKTFEGWTDGDAEVLRNTIQLAAADPKVGAAKMREIADLLDGGDVEGAAKVAAEASEVAGEEHKALTEADIESKVKEALDTAAQERALKERTDEIVATSKELGYEPGTPDYFTLLHIAQYDTAGDLAKAHEAIEARNQKIIDGYVEGARARAAGTPIHGGKPEDSVIDPAGENKTFDSARKRVEQRLVNLRQK